MVWCVKCSVWLFGMWVSCSARMSMLWMLSHSVSMGLVSWFNIPWMFTVAMLSFELCSIWCDGFEFSVGRWVGRS